jgi:hypothetical protein
MQDPGGNMVRVKTGGEGTVSFSSGTQVSWSSDVVVWSTEVWELRGGTEVCALSS